MWRDKEVVQQFVDREITGTSRLLKLTIADQPLQVIQELFNDPSFPLRKLPLINCRLETEVYLAQLALGHIEVQDL